MHALRQGARRLQNRILTVPSQGNAYDVDVTIEATVASLT